MPFFSSFLVNMFISRTKSIKVILIFFFNLIALLAVLFKETQTFI